MPTYTNPIRAAAAQHAQQQAAAAHAPTTSGVQVLVRVRPPLPRELMYDSSVDVRPPYDVKVYNDAQEFSGRYHHVFDEDTPQVDVYEKLRDCVPLALDGYNSTIFAYGQTGTGKTFTMMGDDPAMDGAAVSGGPGGGPGIIPRAVKELFREAKAKQDAEGAAIQVIVSYMEIYNDRLHDLLQPYKPHSSRDPADMNQKRALLEVREDAKGNTYVPNLLCVKVKSYKSVYQLISKGNRNRAVRHTEMNQASSRSHAILQLVVEQWPNGGADGTVLRSKLNFVDLAGSERWNTTAGWEGGPDLMGEERINEMTAINGSLSALGSVVAALTERRPHVPYRDSRLTHLLQDSLGGNCRTTVLATLSPSVDAFEESCSTLRFADRARAIANNPVVNASRDVGSILALKEREIQRLRNMLSQFTGGNAVLSGADGSDGGASRLTEELETTRRALEMERALRTELQQRLNHGGSGGGDGDASGGGILVDGTLVLSMGTPHTAFDAAGTAPHRSGSMRSSAGSAGSGARAAAAAAGADFFRLSTPSTPLNPVPTHLAGSAAAATPSAVLTPTRARGGGAPPLGRSRSNLLSSSGRLDGGGAASTGGPDGRLRSVAAPSPGRRSDVRRLSFDEAILSIKSQIVNLSTQERSRLKARQPPPQRSFWGGLPPPPGPVQPPLVASTSSTAVPATLTGRTRAAVGIYGTTGGAPPQQQQQYHHHHQQQRRPPGLAVGPGVMASGGLGGGGSLVQIPSIEMTESPMGSDAPSPGSVNAMLRNPQRYSPQETSQLMARAQPYVRGSGHGAGRGRDEVPDEVEGNDEEVEDEDEVEDEVDGGRRGGGGGRARGASGAGGAGGSDRSDGDGGDSDGGLSQLDRDEYEELMREAREALAKAGGGDGGKSGLGAQGRGPRAGPAAAATAAAAAGPGLVGGGRAALLQKLPSSAPSAVGCGDGGGGGAVAISGTGWGRNALLHKFTDADTGPGGGAAGGGFGRSSLQAGLLPSSPSPATAPAGGGWGRKSILATQSAAAAPPPASADTAAPPPAPAGRRALIADLMADDSPYGRRSPQRGHGGGGGGTKGRSKSVGGRGRPNGGSRGGAADRVAKLDAGSWIYILGASASSTRAKALASALMLDPRTGLPAI